ncbi:adenylyl cyclase [uncultured Deinococcus sp.]|uniref:adenylyl cyclase n=1 Tax=uncultured Deinococcus sp. TaxID=158789 RepID=UPI0025D38D70|nr:adenylyl cyclase [uncultured Deinococcus sp.]
MTHLQSRTLRLSRRAAALTLTAGTGLLLAACGQSPAASETATLSAAAVKPGSVDLGPNVRIFDPSMSTAQIRAVVDQIAAQQVSNEFGPERYALLFKPGTYGTADDPLIVQVGYGTEVAGLGASPTDVKINGHVDVYNQCNANGCIALTNFWRSLSNLTIQIESKGLDGCRASGNFWAVSQAAPMRRVNVTGGNLTLMDYCTAGPQYASGGFIADSAMGFVINGSQQQFLTRDSSIGGWSNGVWNAVFSGVVGAPAQSFPNPPYTTVAATPVSREKPFLTVDSAGAYQVFVPATRRTSSGTTWQAGPAAGRFVPLSDFYVMRPGDSVQRVNAQLAQGRHLLITPGSYDLTRTIEVKRPGTIVLGLGLPALTPQNGVTALSVADVPGVTVAGIMIDAGPVNSRVLMQVGSNRARGGQARDHNNWSDPATPTAVQDVFFRIGGPHVGRADLSLAVNSDHVILDNLWAWRADHGQGVGWTLNTADQGVVVNGDDVTATGLFVEHYQKYQTVWNGERGKTIMFQNEMPYDPPNQAAWQHDGVLGYAAYKVADHVKTHEAWGLGSYIYTNVDPSIHATQGFEVPVTPGVKMHNLLTVQLGAGTIDHVINGVGAPVNGGAVGVPSYVVEYP